MSGFYVGSLCRKGHDHEGSGGSLRYGAGHCRECFREAKALRMTDPVRLEREKRLQAERGARNKEARLAQSKKSKDRHKEAISERRRLRYYADVEASRAKSREVRLRRLNAVRETDKAHKRRLRESGQMSEYVREYYRRNHLRIRIRNAVSRAIRRQGAVKTLTVAGYGIDVPAIAAHLGPCPGAASDWHIDHIKPLCTFDLSDPVQVRRAFSPRNHQWLTAFDNRVKSGKYVA